MISLSSSTSLSLVVWLRSLIIVLTLVVTNSSSNSINYNNNNNNNNDFATTKTKTTTIIDSQQQPEDHDSDWLNTVLTTGSNTRHGSVSSEEDDDSDSVRRDTHMRTTTTITKFEMDFMVDFGGIPGDSSYETCNYNSNLLSDILQYNASDRTIIIPSNHTFYFHSGIYAANIQNAVLQIDGRMRFEKKSNNNDDEKHSPRYNPRTPLPCFMIDQSRNITITSRRATADSNHRGVIDGQGSYYWGFPIIGFLHGGEHRPRLFRVNQTDGLLIENIIFQDSPYHTMYLEDVHNVEIRNISIVARRTGSDGHSIIDLSAFNTDGIDVSGTNIHIHHVDIWNQDDCIAVKDNYYTSRSSDMVFEHINASGVGFVIGSIGNTTVSNITFRNSYLYKPFKGIYMKFRADNTDDEQFGPGGGIMENILYDNITIEEPIQWPIWIGPAQQADTKRPCHANPCSLCWPQFPNSHCNVVPYSYFHNITLRNITILQPQMSTGVIMGSSHDDVKKHKNDDQDDQDQEDGFSTLQDQYIYEGIATENEEEYNDMINRHPKTTIPHIDTIVFHNVEVKLHSRGTKSFWKSLMETRDLTEMFPGLKQPIQDHYVPSTREARVLIHYIVKPTEHVVVVIISVLVIYCLIRKSKKTTDESTTENEGEEVGDNTEILPQGLTRSPSTGSLLQNELQTPLLSSDERDDANNNMNSVDPLSMEGDAECEGDVTGETYQDAIECLSDDDEEEYGNRDRTITEDSFEFVQLTTSKKQVVKTASKAIRYTIVVLFILFNIGFILYPTRVGTMVKRDILRLFGKQKWNDIHQYYKCTGVINGIATGTTWPVPSCFRDETIATATNATSGDKWNHYFNDLFKSTSSS